MLRWLLPVLAVMTLLGASVNAWAAAGFSGEAHCCCPDKTKCHCFDHDGTPDSPTKLKQCGGEAIYASPADVDMVEVEPVVLVAHVVMQPVATARLVRIPDDVTYEPEKPPI